LVDEAAGHGLQVAGSLNSVNWQPALGMPIQQDGVNTLTVDPAGTAQYFRMFKP